MKVDNNSTFDNNGHGNVFIADVVNSTTWKPTMCLRWYETDNYNPLNDDFDKVLQQKWQGDTGQEKWENIEVYGR
jgi:hypothetical protein